MDIAQLLHKLRVIANVEIVVPLLPEMLFPTQAKTRLEWATHLTREITTISSVPQWYFKAVCKKGTSVPMILGINS
jgi:hypothetical protein